ncbi:hypothetical protein BDP27DRAFT_1426059 [Rhodocollybia butyracea]|uniref:Uncharacterized protein n=1 Tax=Rhodocollybia butyracea TaxID=206335 RepID=A0A9P5PKE8_9AGAR|nr:hypothetical protein BDP27DRAFT_1426059 [Rhodocollybia butyracea]
MNLDKETSDIEDEEALNEQIAHQMMEMQFEDIDSLLPETVDKMIQECLEDFADLLYIVFLFTSFRV